MNKSIIRSTVVHHFADDTYLLFVNKSMKKINQYINHDLKHLCQWLRSNKLSLNAAKTEIVIFRQKRIKITKNLNFRLSWQKIKPTNCVKYLRVFIDQNLTWENHLNFIIPKLNCAIRLLAKIRHYVSMSLLKTIYYSLLNSHLTYAC